MGPRSCLYQCKRPCGCCFQHPSLFMNILMRRRPFLAPFAASRRLARAPTTAAGGQFLSRRSVARALATAAEPSQLAPPDAALATTWSTADWKLTLEQVAEDGNIWRSDQVQLLGTTNETEEEAEDEIVSCSNRDYLRVAEVCALRRHQDFVMMSRLADRVVEGIETATKETQIPPTEAVGTDALLRLGQAFASLGVINAPVAYAIAEGLLSAWSDSAVSCSAHQIADAALIMSAQRLRHEELFDVFARRLGDEGNLISAATPQEALSILRSFASMRLDAICLGDTLWSTIEAQATSGNAPGSIDAGLLVELCHVLFLAKRDTRRLADISRMLEDVGNTLDGKKATALLRDDSPEAQSLCGRLLLLRSCVRYLHKDAYRTLPSSISQIFRRVHRMEPSRDRAPKPPVNFVRKLSFILTKLRIGHILNAEKGPFLLDVVERDRKLVFECNHFDRFYVDTLEKIASRQLQERVVKAMGYRVVQIPHWQWNKVRHKRQRSEYVRMSRYYAIKDRREFSPRFESEPPADVASNQMDYMGEYLFKNEAPSHHWSWFQPRYDASKRLPDSSTQAALPSA